MTPGLFMDPGSPASAARHHHRVASAPRPGLLENQAEVVHSTGIADVRRPAVPVPGLVGTASLSCAATPVAVPERAMSRQTQCTRALAFADQTRPVAAGQFQGIPRDAENGWATVPATGAPASPSQPRAKAKPRGATRTDFPYLEHLHGRTAVSRHRAERRGESHPPPLSGPD